MRWAEEIGPGRAGVRLHVRRVVEPEAPPVLLLHGLGVGGSVWQAFARRLLPHLAAIAPDLRGHGQSDAPPDDYTPADYAADLATLIEHDAPLPVVGHSLGALVALKLAELRPDLVSWLALLDPPVDPSLRNPELEAVYTLRHGKPGKLEAYLLSRNQGGGQLLAQSLANLFRQASDAAFEAMLGTGSFDVRPESVSQPTLVLQADPRHGGVLGDSAASAFVARLPHGTLRKIDGATHSLHASHPAQVAGAILEFAGYSSAEASPSSR